MAVNLKTRWIVSFGKIRNVYYTHYHAEQFARALSLNGTLCTVHGVEAAAGPLFFERSVSV